MSETQEITSIQIDYDAYQRLNSRKLPGDSFNDVLHRVLDTVEDADESDE